MLNDEIAALVEGRLTDKLRLGTEVTYANDTGMVNRGNVTLRYYDAQQRIANISYRYLRDEERFDFDGNLVGEGLGSASGDFTFEYEEDR